MSVIKKAIAALEEQQPPKDYTTDQIRAWLMSIKKAPTESAVRLLVERIDVDEKDPTVFNITSTLNTVGGKHVIGRNA